MTFIYRDLTVYVKRVKWLIRKSYRRAYVSRCRVPVSTGACILDGFEPAFFKNLNEL